MTITESSRLLAAAESGDEKTLIREAMREYLIKAEAVVTIALSDGFFNCEASALHAYRSALSEVISEANSLKERVFDELVENSKPNWFSG